ncbi:hypothetical protein [uncultured Rikenella sp.]|uniref:hypothetical protein n=1 Tax=uncultured Rikenella sp. TaxID=368003 RepID=UPI0025F87755|nr:hypothetical protein [uncultured Rikenella sp.]
MTGFPKGARENTQHPAPGYRIASTGTLDGFGYSGYNWSSTTSGTFGIFLDIYPNGFNASSTDTRAYGRQLRCLSE